MDNLAKNASKKPIVIVTETSRPWSHRCLQQRTMDNLAKNASKKPIVIGNYRLERTIGKGNFAEVKLAIHIPTKSKAVPSSTAYTGGIRWEGAAPKNLNSLIIGTKTIKRWIQSSTSDAFFPTILYVDIDIR
ncbi:MAP/microtubule affinity-regulating kinase 4 [Trichoplax sp. H2]|nr:MAP/microtubule affinity-regulating kinase 4 [Trichoplax sp. H2]|eukprot:RDD44512.1 MAP/microtubule affinity-regulating kinase 4 [Trichoplax sp. H2]